MTPPRQHSRPDGGFADCELPRAAFVPHFALGFLMASLWDFSWCFGFPQLAGTHSLFLISQLAPLTGLGSHNV